MKTLRGARMGARCSIRRSFEAASLVHVVLVLKAHGQFIQKTTVQDEAGFPETISHIDLHRALSGIPHCTGMALATMPLILMPAYKQDWQWASTMSLPKALPSFPHCSNMDLGAQESH